MAIFDAMFEFSDAQSITASAQSTNVLDLQNSDLNMGAGNPVYLNIKVGTTAFNGNCTFALYSHSAATSINSGTAVFSVAVASGSLTAGAWVARIALPVVVDPERYIGIYYTASGNAGTVDAWLDLGPQSDYNTQVATSNI